MRSVQSGVKCPKKLYIVILEGVLTWSRAQQMQVEDGNSETKAISFDKDKTQ